MNNTTILVTHWNTPPELFSRCIDSVIKTGLPYIIVDDGSDKSFRDGLEKYNNVTYLHKNMGLHKALKIGVELVETEFVTKCDSDDFFKFAPIFSGTCDAYVNSFDGKISLDHEEFCKRPFAALNGATIKTEVFKEINYKGNYRAMGDIITFSRLLRKYKVTYYEEDCYEYIPRKGNSITFTTRNSRQDIKNAVLDDIRKEQELV